ncbi:hypothetical protein [Cupriavidus sp. IDO]|uniref:hypothetical protein n=1 Tax=Cupriavidus sp. IDO TaxID=1539142 RepID=UPI000A47B33A
MVRVGEEVSENPDIVPAEFFVHHHTSTRPASWRHSGTGCGRFGISMSIETCSAS